MHITWLRLTFLKPFKRQPHKMGKQTQTISRQHPKNGLSVFDHFVGLALKGLRRITQFISLI